VPRRFRLHDGKRGSALALRITPRASKNSIVGVQSDGTIRIHIAAPPVDDKANQALLAYLAEVLGIAKSRLDIVAGITGRDKLIAILDMDARTAHQRILAHMD